MASSKYLRNYCKTNPCGIGEGDCDNDEECEGDLKCGKNNCEFSYYSERADCCMNSTTKGLVEISL